MESGSRTTITREDGFRFRVRFDQDGMPDIVTDEPAPLGAGAGPNPSRLLAAAIGNCLAASLLFCLQRSRVPVHGLQAVVDTALGRTAEGRLRVTRVGVTLVPAVPGDMLDRVPRCLDLFESFCTVTESVRHGIDVKVEVTPVEARR